MCKLYNGLPSEVFPLGYDWDSSKGIGGSTGVWVKWFVYSLTLILHESNSLESSEMIMKKKIDEVSEEASLQILCNFEANRS